MEIKERYLSKIEKELEKYEEYIKFKKEKEFKPINITVTEEDVERLKDFFDRVERDRIYCEVMLRAFGLEDYDEDEEWYDKI